MKKANILDVLYEKNQHIGKFSANNLKLRSTVKSVNTEPRIGGYSLYLIILSYPPVMQLIEDH